MAQIQPPGAAPNLQQPKDSSQFKKTNTADWKSESVRIFYKQLYSNKVYVPDSSIHSFHRRLITLPLRNVGNSGTPVQNLLFTPEYRTGPTFGYHVFDPYRYHVDSLYYYNTNRPYSVFDYQMGGKLEQLARIMHTQNIKPNWNFSVEYRKINSPGYYNIQRTNHDNANFTTHYQGKQLHYELYAGFVYNKEQVDENGGMLNDSFLSNSTYNDRRTIPVAFQNDGFGGGATVRRSPVTNMLRDFSIMFQHAYTWGRTDTLYNDDSTRYSIELTPRFSISHRLELTDARHQFKDLRPDSVRYSPFFNFPFSGSDSVYSRQKWTKIDNRVILNGFLGKRENQIHFSAGLGNRYDKFSNYFLADEAKTKIISNYCIAALNKEALLPGKWFYGADVITYFTGQAAGNTSMNAVLGKDMGEKWGSISAGLSQNINNAPYSYTDYYNQYDTIQHNFNKEAVTQVHASWLINKFKLGAGIRNYIVTNYIYLNQSQLPDQYAPAFNITQLWVRKVFVWKKFVLDNDAWYQVPTTGAPVNIPKFMVRHQLSIESNLFKSALRIAAGVEVRYHSDYYSAGYSPFFNRFYYQDTYVTRNKPETSVFFNFRIKRFRAYIMGDQVQQAIYPNTIVAPGYAAQNVMARFGFSWALIN